MARTAGHRAAVQAVEGEAGCATWFADWQRWLSSASWPPRDR